MVNPQPPTSWPRVVIDTSVWVSRLLPNDANHLAARNWIVQYAASSGQFVVPSLIVAEIAGAVARITQNPQFACAAVAQLRSFPDLQLVHTDQQLVDDAADIAIDFGLKGADSFYVALAKQLSIPLVTFDQEQLTRPTSVITTIRP